MFTRGGMRLLIVLSAWLALAGGRLWAQATVVFIADDQGNVARYDTTGSGSGTALGSLGTNFSISQIIGAAYDADNNRVLLFDRSAATVYAMDADTGVSSVLFTTGSVVFQGGAVLNGLVYGIDESAQTLVAFTFAGVNQNLTGPSFEDAAYGSDHVHGLGGHPVTQQLFYMSNAAGARVIGTDGTPGTVLLAANLLTTQSFEDVDFFNGNYLVATYSREIFLVDGVTGLQSTFLDDTQLAALGVTGSVSGVAVLQTVPEPGTWALLIAGLAVLAVSLRRRA